MTSPEATARDVLIVDGVVTKVARGDMYTVDVQHGAWRRTVLAKRSGRLATCKIKIVAGDRVSVEIGAYDTSRGRIVHRISGARG